MTSTEHIERYIIGAGFELPELTVAPDIAWVHTEEAEVDATYYDNADADLARTGITLHHETDAGLGTWYVTSSGLQQRIALEQGTAAGLGVPTTLTHALAGHLRRTRPTPALRLTTHRQTSWLHDAEGDVVSVISLDRVCGLVLRSPVRRRIWDSLTVRFTPGYGSDVAGEVRRLLVQRGAGAHVGPDPAERLLGIEPPARPRRMAGLVHDHLRTRVDRVLLDEVAWRAGRMPTAAAHEAVREILATTRVMADAFEATRLRALTADLSRLATVLDAVEAAGLRRIALRTLPDQVPGDRQTRARVRARLEATGRLARAGLESWLDGQRHTVLLDELRRWRTGVPLTEAASRQRKRELRRYLERADAELEWRLRSADRALDDATTLRDRTRLERAALRAVSLAELSQPALGQDARIVHLLATDVRDRLRADRAAAMGAEVESMLSEPAGATASYRRTREHRRHRRDHHGQRDHRDHTPRLVAVPTLG